MQVDLKLVKEDRVPRDVASSDGKKSEAVGQAWLLTGTKGKKDHKYYFGDSCGQLASLDNEGLWKLLKVSPASDEHLFILRVYTFVARPWA